MDSDRKSKAIEEDAEKSQLYVVTRRSSLSSILKPQKPRNPFTTLDFSEPNPDNTLAKAARRVSFASSNLVKPFAADPEKNTIWDTTYEEEINHTDSTKSSYEQTHDTKSNDFLNVTSVYCPESESFEVSIPKIVESDITNLVAIDKENLKPNLKQTAKNTVRNGEIGILETDARKIINIALIDKENMCMPGSKIMSSQNVGLKEEPIDVFKKDISLIIPSNETVTLNSENKICVTEDNIKIINKENFNPIINDITLAAPLENCIKRNTTLKSNKVEMKMMAEDSIPGGDHQVTNEGFINRTISNQSDMELTKTLLVTEIRENIVTGPVADVDKENKTVYFTEGEMDFTTNMNVKSKTIYNNLENNYSPDVSCDTLKDLNFIRGSTNNLLDVNKMKINKNIPLALSTCKQEFKKCTSGRKTIYMDQSNSDMEFTSIVPSKIVEEVNNLKSNCTQNCPYSMELTMPANNTAYIAPTSVEKGISENQPTCFNLQDSNMELTSILPHLKLNVMPSGALLNFQPKNDTEKIIEVNQSISNCTQNSPNCMDLTMPANIENNTSYIAPTSVEKGVNENLQTCFNLQDSNMELTSILPHLPVMPTRALLNYQLKDDTVFEDNMDITTSPGEIESLNNISTPIKSKRKTIHCNQSMDITTISKTGVINENEVNNCMELTNILPVKEQVSVPQVNLMDTSNKNVDAERSPLVNITKSTLDNVITSVLESHKAKNNTASSISRLDIKQESTVDNANFANEFSKRNISLAITAPDYTTVATKFKNTSTKSPQKGGENKTSLSKDATSSTGIKRVSDSKDGSELEMKRKNVIDNCAKLRNSKNTAIDKSEFLTEPIENNIIFNNSDIVALHDEVSPRAENVTDENNVHFHDKGKIGIILNPTPSSNNILYSEPKKIKLKTHNIVPIPDLCENLNLQCLNGTLNLKFNPTSTPASSFHMTLTDMSPCNEDTQQLIYATFSKPECTENKDILLMSNRENCNSHIETVQSVVVSDNFKNNDQTPSKVEEKTSVKENVEIFLNPFEAEQNSCIQDESEVDFKAYEDMSIDDSPTRKTESVKTRGDANSETHAESVINSSSRISDLNNYTLRSQLVLSNINKHIEHYEIIKNEDQVKLLAWVKEAKRNYNQINELINNFKSCKVHIVDLEEKHKHDREESSRVSEIASNLDDDKGILSTAGLLAPKSLYERVREAAQRCKNYWKFEKAENDEYYFFTLFGSLPFKINVHPELGIVYRVKTYTHLEASARPICWYDLKLFQQKLQEKNLLLVLGEKFDILTLLDYVYMMMEEIIIFHSEYIELIKRCGVSHHFRMNPDLSISFEVISIELIIHWIITINMSLTAICKKSIKAVSKVGEKVNEEDINCIAENTPKGPKFLSNFIENVNEYVKRISRRIKMRRQI